MAGNAFTKKYLTELLNERIAKIEENSSALYTADERILVGMRRENDLAEAKVVAKRQPYLTELIELLDTVDFADVRDAPINDEEVIEKLRRITWLRLRITSSTGQDDRRHSYREVDEVEQRIRKDRASRGGTNPGIVLERLKRVRDYVNDSPAEEFSLTLMKSLGFIDIIKTAING